MLDWNANSQNNMVFVKKKKQFNKPVPASILAQGLFIVSRKNWLDTIFSHPMAHYS